MHVFLCIITLFIIVAIWWCVVLVVLLPLRLLLFWILFSNLLLDVVFLLFTSFLFVYALVFSELFFFSFFFFVVVFLCIDAYRARTRKTKKDRQRVLCIEVFDERSYSPCMMMMIKMKRKTNELKLCINNCVEIISVASISALCYCTLVNSTKTSKRKKPTAKLRCPWASYGFSISKMAFNIVFFCFNLFLIHRFYNCEKPPRKMCLLSRGTDWNRFYFSVCFGRGLFCLGRPVVVYTILKVSKVHAFVSFFVSFAACLFFVLSAVVASSRIIIIFTFSLSCSYNFKSVAFALVRFLCHVRLCIIFSHRTCVGSVKLVSVVRARNFVHMVSTNFAHTHHPHPLISHSLPLRTQHRAPDIIHSQKS